MHVTMPRMHGHQWGEPYVRSWHGEGTRLVMWHMWPMIAVGWLIFMLGAMMGKKSLVMRQQMMGGEGMQGMHGKMHGGMMHGWRSQMMGGPCGPGMRKGMMAHHHHGAGTMPCMDPECAEEPEKFTGGEGI